MTSITLISQSQCRVCVVHQLELGFPPSFQGSQSQPASGSPTDIFERLLTKEQQSTRLVVTA